MHTYPESQIQNKYGNVIRFHLKIYVLVPRISTQWNDNLILLSTGSLLWFLVIVCQDKAPVKCNSQYFLKIWNTSWIRVSSLHRGHANLLCTISILVYVLPKEAPRYLRYFHPCAKWIGFMRPIWSSLDKNDLLYFSRWEETILFLIFF